MKSYTFKIRLEEDTFPNGEPGYFVCVPELEHLGAATQGRTKEEAIKNIQEVLRMIIEEFIEEGKPVPLEEITVPEEPLVTITV